MPTPGSHRYDTTRTRLRGKLETEGVPDQHADEAANRIMQQENDALSPAARDDRARGPYGEDGGGGDPGAVVDLRSPAFSDNALMPARCSRDGGDVSPTLEWSAVPEGTVELALLCDDLDSPGGSFLHWLVTGIDPVVRSVDEGAEPPGATSWPNDFGDTGYGGPQPPVGDGAHRYRFRLFALGSPLDLAPDATVEEVRRRLDDKHLATGTLIGLFER